MGAIRDVGTPVCRVTARPGEPEQPAPGRDVWSGCTIIVTGRQARNGEDSAFKQKRRELRLAGSLYI